MQNEKRYTVQEILFFYTLVLKEFNVKTSYGLIIKIKSSNKQSSPIY